jgi:thiol-disulfide isomerase/thioredoxin
VSRVRTFGVAVLAIGALALTGCGRDQPPVVGTTSIAAADREALPPITGSTLDGSPIDLSDLRGKVVVLNSWASWCEPCRSEVPAFVTLDAEVDPAQVAVIGLDVSDDDKAAKAFAHEFGVTYPSVVDADGTILPTIPGVPPAAVPSTVIIDREGRIAVRIIGEADHAELSTLVDQVAAEK